MVDTRKYSTENSGHQLRSDRTSGEGTTSSAPKKNASSAPEIPHSEGKTSSPIRKNASSSEISTGKPVTKGKTSSQKKMNASSSEIPAKKCKK
ncbi:hypothetical protein SASPL_152604 [Salvia splendens]|uniref:Uncharacterized protein n=1 Tax=Salvia splendens TaxID=180675 RepID=A0A8X8Z075_SALSN|nr:hypothetical protein SASPL_152604 [Salvia splendens]